MKSRHTTISGTLSRSFGIDPETAMDLVAEFREDGTIAIREEPADRKLKRGEKLPEVVIDIRQTWESGRKAEQEPEDPSEVETLLDRIIARMPIADFSGPPDKVGYLAKAWLLKEIRGDSKS